MIARRSLLAAALLPAAAAPATLRATLALHDPAALIDHLAVLGATLDLRDRAAVHAAIGPTRGLPTRGALDRGFVGFTVPEGEIVYNAEGADALLLVSANACIPIAALRARIRPPAFDAAAASRITVVLYDRVAYAGHPGRWLTYVAQPDGCIRNVGIGQAKLQA